MTGCTTRSEYQPFFWLLFATPQATLAAHHSQEFAALAPRDILVESSHGDAAGRASVRWMQRGFRFGPCAKLLVMGTPRMDTGPIKMLDFVLAVWQRSVRVFLDAGAPSSHMKIALSERGVRPCKWVLGRWSSQPRNGRPQGQWNASTMSVGKFNHISSKLLITLQCRLADYGLTGLQYIPKFQKEGGS